MVRVRCNYLYKLLLVCNSFTVEAFHASPHRHYRFLLFQAHNNPRDKSNSNDSVSSWHFLPDTPIPIQNEDDILHGCDAVVTTLDASNAVPRRQCWLRFIDDATSKGINFSLNTSSDRNVKPPKEARAAIEATHRWAANFVRELQLCPWSGSSLDTDGAIRYWLLLFDASNDVMESAALFNEMEHIVRRAGRQLEQITSVGANPIDATAAISFVILVPMNVDETATSDQSNCNVLPDFESFHQFFLDLEDRLLDECDEYWDNVDDNGFDSQSESDIPDGCKVTVAAFHPSWRFNSEDSGMATSAIDYEKRTPYPTISIVMSSAIDALIDPDADQSEDGSSSIVTNRIAASNEKTLCKLGVDRLKEMFESTVLCPMTGAKQD